MADVGVFSRYKNFNDFQQAAQQQGLAQALTMAQIQKAQQLDVDALGEQAFMKAAMGAPLSPQEQAAAQYVDAKSGGIMLNPATGEVTQKPRISEKIGLGNLQAMPQPLISNKFPPIEKMNNPQQAAAITELFDPTGQSPQPTTFNAGLSNSITPKSKQKFSEVNIESGRKRLDELIGAASTAGAAKQAAEVMKNLQPEIGYTGSGGGALAFVDKALSALGAPNMISGEPGAREAFQSQGVTAWVKAVEPLKGSLTEREGSRIAAAVPSLSTTPDGIKRLTDITIKMGNRAQQKSQFYEQYFAQNGSLDGADSIWNKYAEENPVITDNDLGVINPRRAKFEANKTASAPKQRLKYNPSTGDFE